MVNLSHLKNILIFVRFIFHSGENKELVSYPFTNIPILKAYIFFNTSKGKRFCLFKFIISIFKCETEKYKHKPKPQSSALR